MGLITKPKTYADNDPIIYSDLNDNWDTLYNLLNGNIDNANIAAGADIDPLKIAGGATTLTTAQTLSGQKTIINPLLQLYDGWIQSADAWVYVASNQFKIVSVDRTALFPKGTRIKCTNNAVTVYGDVIASAVSGSDTLITLAPNDDFSFVSTSLITNPFYSYDQIPQGYPGWFNFTPTYGGFNSAGGNPVYSYKYKISGNSITIYMNATINGTSNDTIFTFTLPVAPSQNNETAAICGVKDNNITLTSPGHIKLFASSNVASVFKGLFEVAFTNTGYKLAYPQPFTYEF